MPNDSQELTRRWKAAVHNDIGLSTDEVRVMGRDTAGGGTYTAILHKNDDGDWVKDLALPFSGDGGYLRHNETKDEIDFNDEAESGLWNIWNTEATGTASATAYFAIKNALGDPEEAKDSTIEIGRRRKDRGNDHIIVGEPYEEATIDYTVQAAESVANMMNWHENDTFNEEMAMVEDATEIWHNSEEPYLEMRVQNGELTAVPTTEHVGPEQIYEFYEDA